MFIPVSKKLVIFYLALAGLCVLAAVVGVWDYQRTTGGRKGMKFFAPELKDVMASIDEIHLKTKESTDILRKEQGQWVIENKEDYPASISQVHHFIIGYSNASIVQVKQKVASFSKEYGFEEEKEVVLLVKGSSVLRVRLGGTPKDRVAKENNRYLYVLKNEEEVVYMIKGQIPHHGEGFPIYNPVLFNMSSARLQRVHVTNHHGQSLYLERKQQQQQDSQAFTIVHPKEKKESFDSEKLQGLWNSLSYLFFREVFVAQNSAVLENQALYSLKYETLEGLQIVLRLYEEKEEEQEARYYIVLGASTTKAAAQTIRQEAANIESRHEKWVYEIDPNKALEWMILPNQ